MHRDQKSPSLHEVMDAERYPVWLCDSAQQVLPIRKLHLSFGGQSLYWIFLSHSLVFSTSTGLKPLP